MHMHTLLVRKGRSRIDLLPWCYGVALVTHHFTHVAKFHMQQRLHGLLGGLEPGRFPFDDT